MISPATVAPTSGLSVALLHNYRDEQQPSMRLYAERLGDALLRRGLSVHRVRPPGVVPLEWRARSSTWAKVDAYVGRFAVYPRLVQDLRADIVHVADHGQGYLVASLDASRTVVTCHDLMLLALAKGRIGAEHVPQVALQLFRMSLELMKRAATVVADSAHTKADLVELVGMDPTKVTVIHPGLNRAFRPDPELGRATRRSFGLPDELLVLQVGKKFYKNIPTILRVLQLVRRQGLNLRLVRVGPPLTSERAYAERLGVADQIIELGTVSDDDLPALYNAVDVLLFPSLYEGFGWPPLEAMASGTPVVCSRGGSLGEVVADGALTADAEDAEALAWHVGAVLTDAKLRRLVVDRGLANARRFSWEDAADQMIDVYRDVQQRAA